MPERLASTYADRIGNDLTPGCCTCICSTLSRHQRTEQGDKGGDIRVVYDCAG